MNGLSSRNGTQLVVKYVEIRDWGRHSGDHGAAAVTIQQDEGPIPRAL